jgi:hypothetical protein
MVSYLPKQQNTAIILHKIPEKSRTVINTSHIIRSTIIKSHNFLIKYLGTGCERESFINQLSKIVC